MLHCVLKQAASPDSKFWSDKLLHETLYLCGVILADEDSGLPNSLCNAATGATGSECMYFVFQLTTTLLCTSDHSFLPYLEVLLTNQRAEEHYSLLSWCVQHLRASNAQDSVMDVDQGQTDAGNSEEEADGGGGEEDKADEMTDAEREAKERREKGLQRRAQLMSQISVMQRRFLSEHKEELDQIDAELDNG